MHYHCEVILPPGTEDIEAAVESVLEPFREGYAAEQSEREDDEYVRTFEGREFWDWYVIGGRFAGDKQLSKYDAGKLQAFYDWCAESKITVSGVIAGKQQLDPAEQESIVDQKWNELFPPEDGNAVACPLFAHSNDQYGLGGLSVLAGDIGRLGDYLESFCSRVIFAAPSLDLDDRTHTGPLNAEFMLAREHYNGLNFEKAEWDGKLGSALELYKQRLEYVNPSFAEVALPTEDWIAVTVDYHS